MSTQKKKMPVSLSRGYAKNGQSNAREGPAATFSRYFKRKQKRHGLRELARRKKERGGSTGKEL